MVGTTIFQGIFNTGDISHSITYNIGGSDNDNELIGNPYPSAIITETLFLDNPRANAFYFWTHEHAETLGIWIDDYAVYNNTGYISGNASAPAPTYIASSQGFFVVGNNGANTPQLTFKNSQRIKDQNNQFLSPINNYLDKIWLNLSNTNTGINNQILIGFNNVCSNQFDNQYDATRFNSSNALTFYSTGVGVDTGKLAIQTRGLLTNDDEIIPLDFEILDTNASSLTISIDHLENLTNTDVFLKDLELNIMHDLKFSAYSFTQPQMGDINNRFELIFSRNSLSINSYQLNLEKLMISNHLNNIIIKTNNGSTISNISIFNILGKNIYTTKTPLKEQNINIENIPKGTVIIIKAKLRNENILKSKFIIH